MRFPNMDTPVIVAILSSCSAVVVAAASYFFTKVRERAADWRKLKIERYTELLCSISENIKGERSPEGPKRFSRACNVLGLIASQRVLLSLREFQDVIRESREQEPTREEHARDETRPENLPEG